MRRRVVRSLAAAAVIAASLCAAAAERERKLYAHYMGCWPAACGPLTYQQKQEAKLLKEQKDRWPVVGGEFVNWPLVPQGWTTNAEATAELEIRRAIRAGFDGFAVDAWSGGEGARQVFVKLIEAAERMKVDFGVTVCLDPSCHRTNDTQKTMYDCFLKTARFALSRRHSPNFARYRGKPLVFGYYSRGIIGWPFRWPAMKGGEEIFERETKEIAAQWNRLRKDIGYPIFLHGDVAGLVNFSQGVDPAAAEKLGRWAAGVFDAVGAFTGREHGTDWGAAPELARAVRDGGAVWSQPLIYQYQNKYGGLISGAGFDVLRTCWTNAMASGSDLMQFVTWNDYGEETSIAPGYGSNYTVSRLNRFFADWWKLGHQPKIEEDELHVSFKRFVGEGRIFPFYGHFKRSPQIIEVVTLLTAPATVELKGYGKWKAPAGISYRQFPEKEGPVEVEARRGWWVFEKPVKRLVSPEVISPVRWRQDETMYAFGTNYDSEWEKDFPGVAPFYYSENADADGDGLPNWFEMVYFGKMPYLSTATAANPHDDPDGDGIDNLAEFRGLTDPRFADGPYRVGDRWCASNELCATVATFNPHRDFRRNERWHSLLREKDTSREFDMECREWAPVNHRFGTPWQYGGGSITFGSDGKIVCRDGAKCEISLGWESPVSGEVLVNGKRRRVAKGEMLRFRDAAELDNLVIELLAKDKEE